MLIGKQGGQLDFLTTAGYSKLGLPGDMTPNLPTFTDTSFGLAFHSDSAFLRGMQARASRPAPRANTNGTIIAARSENDTGNNPHNPMYGICRTGATGELLTLIGSESSDSGGNSMAPADDDRPAVRPTKVDRASDVTGLVDTGELGTLFTNPGRRGRGDWSRWRCSAHRKLGRRRHEGRGATMRRIKKFAQVRLREIRVPGRTLQLRRRRSNPSLDPRIVGPGGIFTQAEYDGDREFQKTAAVMKMVIDGNAGAGTIQMGGYDYHTGERATGETRDLRAGQCIGACLEYAARAQQAADDLRVQRRLAVVERHGRQLRRRPRQGRVDRRQPVHGRELLPRLQSGRPARSCARRPDQQIGWYSGDGSVVTSSSPAANAVNLLVETVILNYMALHGEEGQFAARFPRPAVSAAPRNVMR